MPMDRSQALHVLNQFDRIGLDNMTVQAEEIKPCEDTLHRLSYLEKIRILDLVNQAIKSLFPESNSLSVKPLIDRVSQKNGELLKYIPVFDEKVRAEFPPYVWENLDQFQEDVWEDMLAQYRVILETTPPGDVEKYWQEFCQYLNEIPVNRQNACLCKILSWNEEYSYRNVYTIMDLFSNPKIDDAKMEDIDQIVQIGFEAGLEDDGIDLILEFIADSPESGNIQFFKTLFELDIDILDESVKFLPLIASIKDTSLFADQVLAETEGSPEEKIFSVCFRNLLLDPSYSWTCSALNKRWESVTDSPKDKLLLLTWCMELGDRREEFLKDLGKCPLFSNTAISMKNLSNLKKACELVPSARRERLFGVASQLTESPSIFQKLMLPLSYVNLSDEGIERLKSLSNDELLDTVECLVFMPPTVYQPQNIDHWEKSSLRDLDIEILESYFFPHFMKLLQSYDQRLVKWVSEFLTQDFILVDQPKIDVDSELGQLVTNMYLATHEETSRSDNPFVLFRNISKLRGETFEVHSAYKNVEGEEVCLNLDGIAEVANVELPKWTYASLEEALGTPLITPERIRQVFQMLRERNGAEIDAFISQTRGITLDELERVLCRDAESLKWQKIGAPSENVPDTTVQFNACMHYYLSRMIPPSADSGDPVSLSELEFIDFADTFHDCGPGRVGQLRTMYKKIEKSLPPTLQGVKATVGFFTHYIHDIYRTQILNLLGEASALFQILHSGETNVHESEYLINLIGRRLGLLNGSVTFDPNTGWIHPKIMEKSAEELLQIVLDFFSIDELVTRVQEQMSADLEESSSIKYHIGNGLIPILQLGPDDCSFYSESIDLEKRDPSKERISKRIARLALEQVGILSRAGLPLAAPHPYLSRGVDEEGSLITA